ncbi:MAG: FKBP-type peptidyl-prolyl cis-trans isomerase [Deltaproteobacteria bacterium]
MAKVKRGDKVQIHYTGKLDDGAMFDDSGGSGRVILSPLAFVVGQDEELLPKFQEAVIGLEPGQRVTVKIACEDAYGPRFGEKVFVAQKSEIYPEDERLRSWRWPNGKMLACFNPRKGDVMEISLADGNCASAIVTEITADTITFDANHPLAGDDLTFDITLVDIL